MSSGQAYDGDLGGALRRVAGNSSFFERPPLALNSGKSRIKIDNVMEAVRMT
jgi:hypothetical protein